ncbi:hypothetical protein FGG08_002668 [Glutinoglossum americanum]|uniref:Uncharacterized protein n=1 Tax=Glutinoglossum americanum TaxID=1670608 RepID=A0A9P8L1F2_9PEZI|nr:hypothetical protein FGG08_002668 [Glutinoglossum americanum]
MKLKPDIARVCVGKLSAAALTNAGLRPGDPVYLRREASRFFDYYHMVDENGLQVAQDLVDLLPHINIKAEMQRLSDGITMSDAEETEEISGTGVAPYNRRYAVHRRIHELQTDTFPTPDLSQSTGSPKPRQAASEAESGDQRGESPASTIPKRRSKRLCTREETPGPSCTGTRAEAGINSSGEQKRAVNGVGFGRPKEFSYNGPSDRYRKMLAQRKLAAQCDEGVGEPPSGLTGRGKDIKAKKSSDYERQFELGDVGEVRKEG